MFFFFLSKEFYHENLTLKKMFDFMTSCEIGDDAQNIEKTKSYFKLLLVSAAADKEYIPNDSFLNYVIRKKKKIPKCILGSLKKYFLNKSLNLAFTIMGIVFALISITITVLTFAVPFIPLAISLGLLVSSFVASATSFIAKGFCFCKKKLLTDKYTDFFNNISYKDGPESLETEIEFFARFIPASYIFNMNRIFEMRHIRFSKKRNLKKLAI